MALRRRMNVRAHEIESTTPCESNAHARTSIRPPRVRGSRSKDRKVVDFGRFQLVSYSTDSHKQYMNQKLEEESFPLVVLVLL